jgi:hypothetical protein
MLGGGTVATARRAFVIVLQLIALASTGNAQDSSSRQGVWFNGAIGYGAAHLACDTCSHRSHFDGLDLLLGLGGTLNPHLRVGGVWEVWKGDLGPDSTSFATNLTASLYYYPSKRSGCFAEVAIGVSDYRMVKNPRDGFIVAGADKTYVAGTGLGGTVGFGYEFSLGSDLTLAPRLTETYGLRRGLHTPTGANVAWGWRQHVLALTVVFGLHGTQ